LKLRVLCVGRLSEAHLRDGAEDYAGRIARYLPLNVEELKEEKGARKNDLRVIREREGERLLQRLAPEAFVVVLDERGRSLTSEDLAGQLDRHMTRGTAELVFVIGGAYGLSEAVKTRANLLLSLSTMTFTHQMARLFLLEQIYRGLTILRNEPYHNR